MLASLRSQNQNIDGAMETVIKRIHISIQLLKNMVGMGLNMLLFVRD